MKNRKIVICAFVLVAVLCLGVGFAALQDTLTVNGTIAAVDGGAIDDFNADVYFEDAKVDDTTTCVKDKIEVKIEDVDTDNVNDKLVINVNEGAFTMQGEKVVVTVNVKNESDDSVKVSVANTTAPNGYTVDCTELTSVSTNGSGTLTITITLSDATEVDTENASEFAIDLLATALNA